jgi:hypothetical protein
VPLGWFPRLRDATPAQRNGGASSGLGQNPLPEIDEDISVAGLLGLPDWQRSF